MIKEKHIILFDGECNFCSFWVKYVVKRDKKDVFRFASLQSEKGKELLTQNKIDSATDSIVLIENNKTYIKSTAVFHILKTLGDFLSVFRFIPAFIRDFFYDIIAKYRYSWFGKNDCEFISNQNMKNKFLM